MAYFAPFIDAAGLHLPQFTDIYNYEWTAFQSIYGATVDQDNSDADPQWVNVFSLMINDAFNTCQLVYNERSAQTAAGAALDTVVQYNGIARKSAGYSTCPVVITGIAGTPIPQGVALDQNSFLWDLPLNVTIPSGGTITVTATCETIGGINAAENTINKISTSGSGGTQGWLSVNNSVPASPGQPIEQDSQLKARQAVSVSRVAKTLVASTLSAIAEVEGVTRYNPGVSTPGGPGTSVENPTGANDSWGNPPHSISMVVEGGTDLDVATAIYNNKTPGCFTNGTTSVTVVDPINNNSMVIGFFRPTSTPIYVIANVHGLTPAFNSSVQAAIQLALQTYLSSLQIGQTVTQSGLVAVCMSVNANLALPTFAVESLFLALTPTPTTTADISIDFNAVAAPGTITVNSV